MTDRSELLRQLKIDRTAEPPPDRRRWPLLLAAALVALAGLGGWLALRPPAAIPVRTTLARAADAAAPASLLDAAGYVVARRAATVSAKITGKVIEVLIEEGSRVRDGEVIARLDDSNARAARDQAAAQRDASRATVAEARVNLGNAERDLQRKRGLAADRLISSAELDSSQTRLEALRAALESAERNVTVAERVLAVASRNLDDTVVRAPFSGVVTVKAAQPGEMVSPISAGGGFTRTGIGTIVDMDSLEVEVDVNENFINRVHGGQPAEIVLNAYPDWRIPAEVIAVVPTADRAKATVKVRVGFKTRDARVLPEMGARVSFLPEAASAGAPAPVGVRVPAAAVSGAGASGVVYVVRDDRAERRTVQLGARDGSEQVVLGGLAAGEAVVSGGLERLRDGVAVRVTP